MQIPSAQEEKARKALLLLGLSRRSGNSSHRSGRRVVEQKEIREGTTTDHGLVFLSTAPRAGVGMVALSVSQVCTLGLRFFLHFFKGGVAFVCVFVCTYHGTQSQSEQPAGI